MTEDGEKDRKAGRDRPSRPAGAAARHERRDSASSGATPAGKQGDTGKGARETGGKTSGGKAPEGKSGAQVAKGRPTPSREGAAKRPSLFARITRFLREVVSELRKVIWPTRKEMITYTIVVLIFVIFMVSLVSGLDFAFSQGVLWLFS